MTGPLEELVPPLTAVSNAMVRLHEEQFGRRPTDARSGFSGPDSLTCVLQDALLPAELQMVAMGDAQLVRESRTAFQAATTDKFIAAVEEIVHRKVRAFASAIDPESNVAFENFFFESQPKDGRVEVADAEPPAAR